MAKVVVWSVHNRRNGICVQPDDRTFSVHPHPRDLLLTFFQPARSGGRTFLPSAHIPRVLCDHNGAHIMACWKITNRDIGQTSRRWAPASRG